MVIQSDVKNAFSCTLKTFNILDNFYDACEVFENVFKKMPLIVF